MSSKKSSIREYEPFYSRKGEMSQLINEYDWSCTPLSTPDQWPASLRIGVNTILDSAFPMLLFWGAERTCFYNDAFRPALGREGKHPAILGQPAAQAFAELWHIIAPFFTQVLEKGEPVFRENLLVPLYRNGGLEDAYWTFNYSPWRDEHGQIQGMLVVCAETTGNITRYRNIVESVTGPILIFEGEELIIREANRATLDLWQLDRSVIGRSLLEVRPEFDRQEFPELIRNVLRKGQAHKGYEEPATFLHKDGTEETRYFNFECTPYQEANGDISGVVTLAIDVTAQVESKRKLKVAEEASSYRKAILEAQNEAIPDGIAVVDAHGKILSHNKRFVEIWGIPQSIIDQGDDRAALAYAQTLVVNPQEFIERVDFLYQNTDASAREEIRLLDGRVLERYGKSVVGENGIRYGWAWYFRDITEQKRAAENLNYQKQLLETVTDNTDMALFLMDEKQYCVYMNDRAEQMTGFSLDELRGKQLHYHIHHTYPDGSPFPLEQCPIDQALPTQRRMKGEEVFVHRDGSFYPVAFTASPIVVNGLPTGTVIEVRETSEEKRREQILRESEERFRSIANDAPAFIFMANANADIEYINDTWIRFTGLPKDQALGHGWATITHPDDLERSFEIYNRGFQDRTSYQYEMQQRAQDGEYHWILWQGIPRFLPNREFLGMLGFGFDITERKRSEEALKENEELFRSFSNNIQNLAWIANEEGRIYWYNQRWYDYTGTNEEEMMTGGWEKMHHPEHVARVVDFVKEAWNKGEPWELTFPLRNSSGEYRWFLTRAYPIKDKLGKMCRWIGTNTDINEQINIREALRESEAQLRQLSDFMPQIVWATQPDGYHDFYNQRWYDFTGLGFDETKGQGWTHVVHPGDVERTVAAWDQSLRTGELYEIEYRLRRWDGAYRWLLVRAMPFRNDRGQIVRWLGTSTDIHDQKNQEQKLEELVAERTEQLRRSNEDLQQFAHVASHDLKEPVRKIVTFSGRLKEEFGSLLPERGTTYLSKIEKGANRMYDMIDGVLLYSSMESMQQTMREVDLNEVIANICSDLEVVIALKKAVIEAVPLPTVAGVPVLVYQLFYNLINNSLKFGKPDVPPVIRLASSEVGAEEMHELKLSAEGRFVHIRMEDNGIGFAQDDSERIFQTFSRLNAKDKYEGTGLGLALCRKIVLRHCGRIWAEGEPGVGAVFHIVLPVSAILSENLT